jgi:hypothetical protein
MNMAEKISAKQAAIEVGTDARTLRKFLRSDASPFDAVGQGNRYEFTKGEVKKLKKLFLAWGNGSKKQAKVIEEDPTEEEPEEAYEDADPDEEDPFPDGPSDEDLEEIELELD